MAQTGPCREAWALGTGARGATSVRWAVCVRAAFGQRGIKRGGQGGPYSVVRGEILRPTEDELERRQSPGTRPLIKNESAGIEDDQIPS